MLKDFNGHTFKTHGIIPSFLMEIGVKTISFEVQVVDKPLDYNLLLNHS